MLHILTQGAPIVAGLNDLTSQFTSEYLPMSLPLPLNATKTKVDAIVGAELKPSRVNLKFLKVTKF